MKQVTDEMSFFSGDMFKVDKSIEKEVAAHVHARTTCCLYRGQLCTSASQYSKSNLGHVNLLQCLFSKD